MGLVEAAGLLTGDVGFRKSLVIPASLDFPPYVYIDGHKIAGLPNRIRPASRFPEFLRKGELGSDFSIVDCLIVLPTSR